MSPISNTPQIPFVTDFNLTDALNLSKKDIFLSMNCHAIGTIQSFTASNQTASATIAYQKVFFRVNSTTQAYEPYLLPYPLLIDAPVICLGGGAAALTFPITAGDECLILFNDRDIDNWFASNTGGAPATARSHAFTDGFILVGIRSLSNVIENYDTANVVIQNDQAKVAIGPSLIRISNATQDLKTILVALVNAIETATYGGNAIDSTVALDAVKSSLGELLV